MLFLFAVLVVSVALIIGVAVAVHLRIREKVDQLPVEEHPSDAELFEAPPAERL